MPTQRLPRSLSQGLCRSRDASTLKDGELTIATGCEYRVGSPHLYKREGRTDSGAALGSAVTGIRVANFDTSSDVLVAVAGTSIYEGTPSTTPAFGSAVVTGLTSGATPSFAQAQDRLIFVNGTDQTLIREPNGTWVPPLQPTSYTPSATLSSSGGNEWKPNAGAATSLTGTGAAWFNLANAYDSVANFESTYAHATVKGGTDPGTAVAEWTFASQAVTDPTVRVSFQFGYATTTNSISTDASTLSRPQYVGRGSLVLSYKIGAGAWTTFYTGADPIIATSAQFVATWLTDLADLTIRSSVSFGDTSSENFGDVVASSYMTKVGQIFNIYTYSGGTLGITSAYPLVYRVAERYKDSEGIEYTSATGLESEEITLSNTYSVTLTLPGSAGKTNAHATQYVIYRGVAIDGGRWPTLYEIDTVDITQTSYVDGFSAANDPREVPAFGTLYPTIDILGIDGVELPYDLNTPPPISKHVVSWNGSMIYLPASTEFARTAFYTPTNVQSPTSLVQVPSIYYLRFDTPFNDTPTTCVACNGGRALAFFFDRYTMLVNTLPQSSDTGVFDARVREYISTSRGSAGIYTACEFTLPSGQTLVASADSLGLWATNGVSEIMEWSNDFDWLTEMSGVTLSTARLRDNPIKRRLELIYTKSGQNYELHFFYGRLKQDADGKTAPLITGPHIANISDVHYFNVGGSWLGWSAGTSASGKVYNELTGTTDAALSYDSSGSVPFVAKTGDNYVTGLGGSHLIEALYPKFESGTASVTVASTVTRDAGTSRTITNTFNVGTQKKVFHHAYADRHSVQFSHINTSSMPALVGYEIEVRDAGTGRDK